MAVGHVTADVIAANGSRRPGGGAFYSALQAARLGLRALILTQGSTPELEALLAPHRDELELRIVPAEATTTFATSWPGGRRSQRVLAWAGPILGPIEVDTRILHFAPVARETPAGWRGHTDFVGLTPQGLARTWESRAARAATSDTRRGATDEDPASTAGAGGELRNAMLSSDSLDSLLPRGCNAVVISEQERAACAPLLDVAMAQGAVIAITAGQGATTVKTPPGEATAGEEDENERARRSGGRTVHVQTSPVTAALDDLGAGDVFAAAFFVALHEGLPPVRAAAFANAAAAVRIEGVGADAIGGRHAIEERLTGAGERRR